MDVLSGVVESMRTDPEKFFRSRRGRGWGNLFGPYHGAGLHVVLNGSCWLIRDDLSPLELRAGDVLLLPHGSAHGLADRPDIRLRSLAPDPGPGYEPVLASDNEVRVDLLCGAYELDRALVHPMLRSLPDVVFVLTSSHHRESRSAVDMLTSEFTKARPGGNAAKAALLSLVLMHVLRAWIGAESAEHPNVGWGAALADPALAAALDGVHSDPAHPWTVAELAAASGMSRTTFARRFSSVVGQPPLAYVTWWRLNCAARALRSTDAPLARISRDVGYGSQFAFANAFRREMGISPGQFRNREGHGPAG